jgi:hypothetical protein
MQNDKSCLPNTNRSMGLSINIYIIQKSNNDSCMLTVRIRCLIVFVVLLYYRLMPFKPSMMKTVALWDIAHNSITSQIDGAMLLTLGSSEYEIMKLKIDNCNYNMLKLDAQMCICMHVLLLFLFF